MSLKKLSILFLLVHYSPSSYADDEVEQVVVSVQQGDVAPFDGTLFSTKAAAEILVRLENQDVACQIKIDREVGIREAELTLEIERATIARDACEEKYKAHIDLKREEINFLYDRLRKAEKNKDILWFGAGTVAGIGLTALSVWILDSISSSAN